MNRIDKTILQLKDSFREIGNDLRKEQKEFFFHKKEAAEEEEYFNFFKFLFQSPDKRMGF
jgi:hypothetical protein